MLAYHDASGHLGGIHQEDLSSYNQRLYSARRRQRELDVLETSKTQRCLKKTTKFLFSHIGLVGLVVIYSVAGGFLFQLLEIRQERINCQEDQAELTAKITYLKQNIISYIQNNATPTSSSSGIEKDNTTVALAKISAMIYDYRDFVITTSSKYRSYGDNCSIINKWTYPNSLLFAITIITTIGYGNITPVTWEGQLCCLCYATIGIPIFLLCLANISGVLGELFRFLYAKIICGPCLLIKKRQAKAHRAKLEEESGINNDHRRSGGWTLKDDRRIPTGKGLTNPISTDDELDEDEQMSYRRVGVPLTVTMVIIAAYIWIGSALFHSFEGWTMIQSGYFCFITLSTIGFGDFVPGQQKDDPNASAKLILGSIYALFGMAILAMCFDLMQEEIIAKFRWIGTKIGIVEKAKENNENDIKNQQSSSFNERNTPIKPNENGLESPTQRNSSATRKSSPRNNVARIHPLETNSANEATLHQRIATSKPY